MKHDEDKLNPIKETFSMEVFKSKMYLPPHEYYLYVAERAIGCGLLTNAEFKMWSGKFRLARLDPVATCRAFDVIIKKRWEERDTQNYYSQINREANERNSFSDKVLKRHATRTK